MKEDANLFSIDSQGFIYDCEHWVGHPDKSFARLGDEAIIKKISECPAFNDECKDCACFPKCMGGCAAKYLSCFSEEEKTLWLMSLTCCSRRKFLLCSMMLITRLSALKMLYTIFLIWDFPVQKG